MLILNYLLTQSGLKVQVIKQHPLQGPYVRLCFAVVLHSIHIRKFTLVPGSHAGQLSCFATSISKYRIKKIKQHIRSYNHHVRRSTTTGSSFQQLSDSSTSTWLHDFIQYYFFLYIFILIYEQPCVYTTSYLVLSYCIYGIIKLFVMLFDNVTFFIKPLLLLCIY